MTTITEQIDSHIEKLATLKALLTKLDIPADFENHVNVSAAEVVFYARSMEGVGRVRHFLRERLGTWTDSIRTIWASGGSGLVEYRSPDWPIEIRLSTPIAAFPKEITGDTCRFEERISTDYAYVCNGNGAKKESLTPCA